MKSSKILIVLGFGTLIWCSLANCTKKKNDTPEENNTKTVVEIKSKTVTGSQFNYKVFYPEANAPQNRKGLIILAVGDGGNEKNGTLNAQCNALAQKGYVAITTTYRPMPQTYVQWYINFKQDKNKSSAKKPLLMALTEAK